MPSESYWNTMDNECQNLLSKLKSAVEGICNSSSSNGHTNGTLDHLYTAVERIFKHECKVFDSQGEPVVWNFVQGLAWLQPCLNVDEDSKSSQSKDVAMPWLYKCLQDRRLSDRLSWLLSDRTHVSQYYEDTAILSSPQYTEAAILCLMAYEQNLLPLLTIINPKLYTSCLSRDGRNHFQLTHRKSISFPESIILQQSHCPDNSKRLDNALPRIKPWASVPELSGPSQLRKPLSDLPRKKSGKCSRRKAIVSPSLLKVDYPSARADERSRESVPEAMDALGYFFNNGTNHATSSLQNGRGNTSVSQSSNYYNINITSCASDGKRKSFMQDGGNSILPMALGNFPKPAKGESLLSFLSSSQYSRSNAELDRENSHFYIAEAVICVVEQVKWEMELTRLRLAEDRLNLPVLAVEAREDHCLSPAESIGTIHSAQEAPSEVSSSPYQSARCSLSLGEEDSETLMHNSCSDSMLSLSIDSIHRQSPPVALNNSSSEAASSSSSSVSAEAVALSLLRKFSDQQLPAASDIHWLMSEENGSPLETSPLSSSGSLHPEDSDSSTLLRGTYEWAPPRSQIIFFPHPTPVRHVIMMKQNLRCAGCGMRVALQYSAAFRYCSYLGRYFCTGCHTNQTALIPGKIIHAWNFKKYPVSKFSFELLESMASDPLFRISDLNATLFRKVQVLGRVNKLRHQLHSLKDFLLTCRFADSMRAVLLAQEPHLLMEPELYSLQDLLDVRTGALHLKLKDLVAACSAHVYQCQLCLARGFMCELCGTEEIIFPWQLSSVQRCSSCGACYHARCFSRSTCKRCLRLRTRQDNGDPG